jgi:hypothetical protein
MILIAALSASTWALTEYDSDNNMKMHILKARCKVGAAKTDLKNPDILICCTTVQFKVTIFHAHSATADADSPQNDGADMLSVPLMYETPLARICDPCLTVRGTDYKSAPALTSRPTAGTHIKP